MSMTQRPGAPDVLQYMTINDFSPGIIQKLNSFSLTGASPAQLGAARLENTYRCVALPNGGLGPLPKRYYDYSRAAIGNAATRYVTGFNLMGPISSVVTNFPQMNEQDTSLHNEEYFLGFGYESGGNHIERMDALQPWSGAATLLNLFTDTDANLTDIYGPWYIDTWTYANGFAPPVTGYAGALFSWARPWNNVFSPSTNFIYPDPAIATPFVNGCIGGGGPAVAHQSRIVASSRAGATASGFGTGQMYRTTPLNFSDPMDDGSVAGEFLAYGYEKPFGIGALASLSASDLLVIHNRGGAYLIQGDLAYPTVRHLPGVMGTGGTECVGTSSALGFVYGVNKGGVRVWSGGESSLPLASQLEDNFWMPPGMSKVRRYKGKFATWKDYILAPNNWLFDTNTKGWWKLEDNAVMEYGFFESSGFNNVLYGARTTFSDASPICISGWDPAVGASSYSWQSQPLGPSLHRVIDVREVQIIVQGAGTITYTLTGGVADVTAALAIPAAAASVPQMLRTNVKWQGSNVLCRVEANSGSSAAAPVIYAIKLGYKERMDVAKI